MQITGNVNTSTAVEVDTNIKALRASIRPNDYGSLGMYSNASVSGVMAAGLAANAPIWSMQYTGSNLLLLRKLIFTGGSIAAFTAGIITVNAFTARSFSVADTGGGSVAPGTGGNKKRTANMGSTGVGSIRQSSTATLTAGTRTLDSQPFASLTTSVVATAGTPFFGGLPTTLFEARAGEYPQVAANNEGFVIQITVPATGTWTFSVIADWEEQTTANWF